MRATRLRSELDRLIGAYGDIEVQVIVSKENKLTPFNEFYIDNISVPSVRNNEVERAVIHIG